MLYIHKRTRVVIDSPCVLSGGDWVKQGEIEAVAPTVTEETTVESNEENIENAEYKKLTREDIMQELDAFGVEYDKKATKEELYNLMKQGE